MSLCYNNCKCSIKINNVSVKKTNGFILKSVSLNANHGEILALVGENGSGKTTMLKCILGRVSYKGEIFFFNSSGLRISKPKIGYVPQKLIFEKNTPITVLDFFSFNLSNFPQWLFCPKKNYIKILNILKSIDAQNLIEKKLDSLSGGELQKILFAFALEPKPDILLLDEPSTALDSKGVDNFYKLIISLKSKFHMPIILVSHDLKKVQKIASKYAIINDGKILEKGDTNQIINNSYASIFFKD